MINFFNKQWKKGHTIFYQFLILLLCLYYVAEFIYKKTLRILVNALKDRLAKCFKCCKKSEDSNEATSGDFYKELLIDPLHDALKKASYEKTLFERRESKAFDMDAINKYRGDGELPIKPYEDYQSMLDRKSTRLNSSHSSVSRMPSSA